MTQQIINVGTADKGNGDPIRTAFTKVNANFTDLYTALGLVADANLNLGAFEFNDSIITTTDSSAITIDQAVTISSDLNVGGNIVPNVANGGDLGSLLKPFRSLYVSTGTVYLGGVPLSIGTGNTLLVNNAPISTRIEYTSIPNAPTDVADLTDLTNLLGGGGGGGSGDRLTSGQTEFILNIDGSITFPTLSTINWEDGTLTGPTLQMGNDPTSQVIITGPAPNSDNASAQRFVIQGQQGFGGEGNTKGEGGDVYIWAGSGGDAGSLDPRGNGGDVKLRAGLGGNEGGYIRLESGDAQADTGYGGFLDLNAGNGGPIGGTGGNVNIRAGGGNANGGNVNINAGQGDTNTGGNVSITAGYGAVTSGEVMIETDGGSWYFRNTGELQVPSGSALKQNNTWTRSTSPSISSVSAVVWTSNVNYISGAKLTIQVEANEVGDATGWHSQVCEAVIASRGYANSAGGPLGDPVMAVYGVTYTSTVPLVTFTVQRNPTTNNVEVVGTMTAAATSADLRIHSVETSTRD